VRPTTGFLALESTLWETRHCEIHSSQIFTMAKRKSPLDDELVAQPARRRSARLKTPADATATTAMETNTRHGDKREHSTKNTNKVNIAHHHAATHLRHLLDIHLVTVTRNRTSLVLSCQTWPRFHPALLSSRHPSQIFDTAYRSPSPNKSLHQRKASLTSRPRLPGLRHLLAKQRSAVWM
jgi:hypothetical protein